MFTTERSGFGPVETLESTLIDGHAPSICVDASILATDVWEEFVDATQSDYFERGVAIARHSKTGKISRSKIHQWHYELPDEGEEPEAVENECPVPMFPFGVIRSLLSPRMREDVYLHTHPMPPVLDHLKTNPISDKDLQAFSGSNYKAFVILDRGGAHLLARTSRGSQPSLPAPELVGDITREVIAESGGSIDVMIKVARGIAQHGLGYYHTPILSQRSSVVEFQNLRKVETTQVSA